MSMSTKVTTSKATIIYMYRADGDSRQLHKENNVANYQSNTNKNCHLSELNNCR